MHHVVLFLLYCLAFSHANFPISILSWYSPKRAGSHDSSYSPVLAFALPLGPPHWKGVHCIHRWNNDLAISRVPPVGPPSRIGLLDMKFDPQFSEWGEWGDAFKRRLLELCDVSQGLFDTAYITCKASNLFKELTYYLTHLVAVKYTQLGKNIYTIGTHCIENW